MGKRTPWVVLGLVIVLGLPCAFAGGWVGGARVGADTMRMEMLRRASLQEIERERVATESIAHDRGLAEWMVTNGKPLIDRADSACYKLARCARFDDDDDWDPAVCIPSGRADCANAVAAFAQRNVPRELHPFLIEEADRGVPDLCYAAAVMSALNADPSLTGALRRAHKNVEAWGATHGGAARVAMDTIGACPEPPHNVSFDDWLNARYCCLARSTLETPGHCTLAKVAAMHAAGTWPPPLRSTPQCAGAVP